MLKKLLIVDDFEIIRKSMQDYFLETGKFELDFAENGLEAFQKCKEKKFDLILMDISMPIMNGIEATRKIMAAKPDSKIMAVTLHSEQEDVDRMKKAGARGYLLKEFIFDSIDIALEVIENGGDFFDETNPLFQRYLKSSQTEREEG